MFSLKCAYACSRLPVTIKSCTVLAVSYLLLCSVNPHLPFLSLHLLCLSAQMLYVALICSFSMWIIHVVHVPLCNALVCQGPTGTSGEESTQKINGSVGHGTCVLHVAEVPAEVTLWEGDRGLAADSQGHTVDVSARLGMETGVETTCHAIRTGDAVKETEELIGRVELDSGTIRTRMSYQKNSKNVHTKKLTQ